MNPQSTQFFTCLVTSCDHNRRTTDDRQQGDSPMSLAEQAAIAKEWEDWYERNRELARESDACKPVFLYQDAVIGALRALEEVRAELAAQRTAYADLAKAFVNRGDALTAVRDARDIERGRAEKAEAALDTTRRNAEYDATLAIQAVQEMHAARAVLKQYADYVGDEDTVAKTIAYMAGYIENCQRLTTSLRATIAAQGHTIGEFQKQVLAAKEALR